MPVLAVAVLVLAAAAATLYLIHANRAPPEAPATAGPPIIAPGIKPGSAESEAQVRDTVIWRDEAGAVYRAKVGGGRLDQFLRQRKGVLEAARTASRDQAAGEILAALRPVFADMTARVPGYADWYFGYLTKYELMGQALLPALGYLGRNLDFFSGQDSVQAQSLVQAIGPHVIAYIEEQYAERVVRPREAEIRLQAAFDKSYGALRADWRRIGDEQRGALIAFIREQAGAAERLSADQAAGIELDWDGRRADGSAIHEDIIVERSFRRGLLSIRLKIAHSAGAPAQPVKSEDAKESDEITHVIVSLFDKLVGLAVSQMSDLAIGVFAGSAAGATTAGYGMAGGFGMAGPPSAFAAGVATAVPIGAAIGFAATVAAEMLTNRLEESLNRTEFEEKLRQTVGATENALESGMISVLHELVEAWYADIVDPVAVK